MSKPESVYLQWMAESRRTFIRNISAAAAAASLIPLWDKGWIREIAEASRQLDQFPVADTGKNEDFWAEVRKAFYPPEDFINLENGYYSPAPRPVLNEAQALERMVNAQTSFYMRRQRSAELEKVRERLAEFAGVDPEEIALTRNTTESLDILIHGMELQPGDEVITTHQDYGSMLEAYDQQAARYGITVRRIMIPVVPESDEEIVQAFLNAVTDKTRVILVTHMINLNGQILPVAAIRKALANEKIEIITDGAHSFAHLTYQIPDLKTDYFGTSLHKWLSAPLGNGLLYMKKEKIEKVWPLFGDVGKAKTDIRKFEHQGTRPPADYLAIEQAIDFHQAIGGKRKEARLRFLKNYWAREASNLDRIRLNTSLQEGDACAIANFTVEGMEPQEISDWLFEKHRIFTVAINTRQIKGVRVTPHLYNTVRDLDKFLHALNELSKQ